MKEIKNGLKVQTDKLNNGRETLAIVGLVFLAALSRWLPHADNFTPVLAVAFFAGFQLRNTLLAVAVSLIAMLLSDWAVGFHDQMTSVYASVAVCALLGWMGGRSNSKVFAVFGGLVGSSVLFFLVTNFFVWKDSGLYPLTPGGLLESYVMAIPFFHNTWMSTLVFGGLLFTGWHYLAKVFVPHAEKNQI